MTALSSQPSPLTGAEIWRWRESVCAAGQLLPRTRLVLLRLSFHVDRQTGKAWPSLETLAAETATARSGVQRHVSTGIEQGWLRYAEDPRRGRVNRYQLSFPHGVPVEAGTVRPASTPVQTGSDHTRTEAGQYPSGRVANSPETSKSRRTIAPAVAPACAPATTPAELPPANRGAVVLKFEYDGDEGGEFDYTLGPWWLDHSGLIRRGAFDHVLPALAGAYGDLQGWLSGLDVRGGVTLVHFDDDDRARFAGFLRDPVAAVRAGQPVPWLLIRAKEQGLQDFLPALGDYMRENHTDYDARRWRDRRGRPEFILNEEKGLAVPRRTTTVGAVA